MMKNKDFAVFILTHGRPDNIKTINTLKTRGYTGRIFYIIDDEDKTAEKYYENFGREQVIMFSKSEMAKTFDQGDNFNDRRTITYARNACFEIAKRLGITYFIQLDDDYTDFRYKFFDDLTYGDKSIKNLDKIFDLLLDYYKSIPALSIAMAQGGDFIGGKKGTFAKKVAMRRKCMNSFICSTERPFKFIGRMNEDVNTYTSLGSRGKLFLTITNVALQQMQTQTNAGGITELYKKFGTYVKSFNTVMHCPSSVRIGEIGQVERRIHHKINWACTVPRILSEEYKKK